MKLDKMLNNFWKVIFLLGKLTVSLFKAVIAAICELVLSRHNVQPSLPLLMWHKENLSPSGDSSAINSLNRFLGLVYFLVTSNLWILGFGLFHHVPELLRFLIKLGFSPHLFSLLMISECIMSSACYSIPAVLFSASSSLSDKLHCASFIIFFISTVALLLTFLVFLSCGLFVHWDRYLSKFT